MRQIEILDTTLRDGEQAPGAALGAAAKLRMAQSLADLGVDAIEAGFPAASAEELGAVRDIARRVEGSTIVALARATDGDVDAAAKAAAPSPRTTAVFVSRSTVTTTSGSRPRTRSPRWRPGRSRYMCASTASVSAAATPPSRRS